MMRKNDKRSHEFLKSIFGMLKSITYHRDKNIILFGAWFGEKFADNPKYLYLQALRHEDINAVWITKNIDVYNQLKNLELPVELADSSEGKAIQKKAKYFVICTGKSDISNLYNMGGAIIINLWHGIPLKKIMWADKYHRPNFFRYLAKRMVEYLPLYKEYIISTSETMQKIYMDSFLKRKKYVPILGQPRNDLFFLDIFPESESAKKYKFQKVITYMPTHRDEGKTFFDIGGLIDFNRLENICDKYGYVFLIKKHFYHRNEKLDLEEYKHINDLTAETVDTQELLKYTNILITDYSSCYIDYLLLNRPIIYFAFDYEHYIKNDREMYFDYYSSTAGPIVETGDELLTTIEEAILNPDLQYEKRQKVKNIFYNKSSSEACGENILRFIKSM